MERTVNTGREVVLNRESHGNVSRKRLFFWYSSEDFKAFTGIGLGKIQTERGTSDRAHS